MTRFHAHFLAVSLSALLVLSALGPLVDHHYAERDPAHAHLGAGIAHVHDYATPYAHDHARQAAPDAPSGDAPLLSRDAAPLAITTVVTDRDSVTAALQFEPTSLFDLPLPPAARPRSESTPPPDRPPCAFA